MDLSYKVDSNSTVPPIEENYPSFIVTDNEELLALCPEDEIAATVKLKVSRIEAHTKDRYHTKAGSCVEFQVLDLKLDLPKPVSAVKKIAELLKNEI